MTKEREALRPHRAKSRRQLEVLPQKKRSAYKSQAKGFADRQFGSSIALGTLSRLGWENSGRTMLSTERKILMVCWGCAPENQITDEMRFVSHPLVSGACCAHCHLQEMSHPLQNLSQLEFNQPPGIPGESITLSSHKKMGHLGDESTEGELWVTQVRTEDGTRGRAGEETPRGEGSEAY